MRPYSSMWTVLWTVQMMIQAVKNDFNGAHGKYWHNQLHPSNSVNRNQQTITSTPRSQTISYTCNQHIGIGNSIKGDTRYKIVKGNMCNRIHKLRLNKRRERGWKVNSRDELRGDNSYNLADINLVVRTKPIIQISQSS